MPIERYQQAQTPTLQNTQQQAGMASQVQAQAYKGLEAKLKQFESTMLQLSGRAMQADAVEQGTIDVQRRKEQIQDIRNKYAKESKNIKLDSNSSASFEDQRRASYKDINAREKEEIANVTTAQKRSSWGIYGRAYNGAANAAYSNQVTADASEAANVASAQSNGDPELFARMMGSFAKETIAGAPTTETGIVASQAFQRYGSAGYKALATTRYRRDQANNKIGNESTLDRLADEFTSAFMLSNDIDAGQAMTQYEAAVMSGVDQGFYSMDEGLAKISHTVNSGFYARARDTYRIAENYGSQDYQKETYNDLIINNSMGLSLENVEKLREEIFGERKRILALEDSRISRVEKAKVAEQKVTYEGMVYGATDGTLTISQVNDAQKEGRLNPSDAKILKDTIGKGGKTHNNLKLRAFYANPSVMILTTNDQIANMPGLSEPDRMYLYNERSTYDRENKWTSKLYYKEGLDRIKRRFGIYDDTLVFQLKPDTRYEFDLAYRDYFDALNAAPADKRESYALDQAAKSLAKFSDKKQKIKDDKAAKVKTKEDELKADLKEKTEKYKSLPGVMRVLMEEPTMETVKEDRKERLEAEQYRRDNPAEGAQ